MAFTLPELPYGYDALEPHYDKETLEIHYSAIAIVNCPSFDRETGRSEPPLQACSSSARLFPMFDNLTAPQ